MNMIFYNEYLRLKRYTFFINGYTYEQFQNVVEIDMEDRMMQ